MRSASTNSVGTILLYGFIIRLLALSYSIVHDSYISHIAYTDIDYNVFTNGSLAIVEGRSPYNDTEYRYPPLVALIFVPNVLLNASLGKFILIVADIIGGYFQYMLNIYEGTNRYNSKLYLMLWLFNPVTIAISTRGSFEPIITLLVLASIYLLIEQSYILGGLTYGLSTHIKLYPVIYMIAIYGFMIQRKPYLITQSRVFYWIRTIAPNMNHVKFFTSAFVSLVISTYFSYKYYGWDYLEQSILYHLRRRDLQHNFSVYFYLFRLLPQYSGVLSSLAFVLQAVGVAVISTFYLSMDTNRRIRLRKLSFSLFCSTFLFVSLNKVCTSQYFNWYLIFLPLILDSLRLSKSQAYSLMSAWLLSQANWLFFAYLYEYQKFDIINLVGNSSIMFLLSNMWILSTLCSNFDSTLRRSSSLRDD